MSFATKVCKCSTHQVHGSQCMVKPGMKGTGIYKISQAELFDPAQSLEVSVLYDVKYQITVYIYEPINRIIKNFLFIQNISILKLND